MLRNIIGIGLGLIMLLSSSPHLTYLLIYKTFQDKITRDFCINKNKPGSCCKGSCHLAKVEKKSEGTNNFPYSSANFKIKDVEWVKEKITLSLIVFNVTENKIQKTALLNTTLSKGFLSTLLHPPCC